MAVEVIGQDEEVAKTVTCKNCGAILKYYHVDTQTRTYSCMGDTDTIRYIECPKCKKEVKVKW